MTLSRKEKKKTKTHRYIQRYRENVLYNIWYTVSEGSKLPSSQSRAPYMWWLALQFQETPSPVIIHIPFKKSPIMPISKFLEIYMRLKTDCSRNLIHMTTPNDTFQLPL